MKQDFCAVATWKMSLEGIRRAGSLLQLGADAGSAVEAAVSLVEAEPSFRSVGVGGLPAKDGTTYLDAGFMDGNTRHIGAVLSVTGIASPLSAARRLCGRRTNWMLAGDAARRFALKEGLAEAELTTPESLAIYREALEKEGADPGHDTIGCLALDRDGALAAGTSTSGLFLKEPGRIGDSPVPGCGFFADSRFGAAAATGLGEDIMRGCLSYETVARMRRGESPQAAAEGALSDFLADLAALGEPCGSIALVALGPDGRFGAATTDPVFPFCVSAPGMVQLYACRRGENGRMAVSPASPAELQGLD